MGTGVLLLFAAGICQGSFGLGYKKYHPFSWAAFWGIYNMLCIVTSVIFTWMTAPKLWAIIFGHSFSYWSIPILCGALWGLSAIGFSKGISKIGMSMVYGISMGISTIVGSVMPMVISGTLPTGNSLVLFAAGLILTIAGVAVITIAGVKRDGKANGSVAGIILAVLSGFGSGAMNIGFSYSESIDYEFTILGYSQAAVSSTKWLPVLAGGCMAGIIWCAVELYIKHEWHTLTSKGSSARILKLFGVSVIWYLALLLYGLSSSMLGSLGNSVGWILFNSLALIVSVFWGLKTGEWTNKNKSTLFAGCGILIVSWIFSALV